MNSTEQVHIDCGEGCQQNELASAAGTAAIQQVSGAFRILKIFGGFRVVLTALPSSTKATASRRTPNFSASSICYAQFSSFGSSIGELRNSAHCVRFITVFHLNLLKFFEKSLTAV
ncbi:MAG: hypothetical protein IKX40_01835 [Thermoguttaceae bacterium]|nr:hypothetical protein [Thermoguttaceae bacterium]